jgi:transposase
LGNPTGFHLTPGQAHDLHGADALLNNIKDIGAFLADKAYDALERMIAKLKAADCQVVIPPKSNRTEQRPYDEEMYKWRHLIENFFQKIKEYRGIATRFCKTDTSYKALISLIATVIRLK